jgi:putative thioredoxin
MVIDVDEAGFQQEVLDRSRQTPVVVDFWAEWCGPCRTLGPVLEKAADARQGKVVLAKLDTDANPGVAATYGIQGIPAVKAFRDGAVVDEFVGAQPPAMVERFFDALVPSEADGLIDRADEASLRKALEIDPGRAEAAVPLARMLHSRGEDDEALGLLEPVNDSFEADGLAAHIELEREDPEAIEEALEALHSGQAEAAIEALLDALQQADGSRREDLRRIIVGELAALGQADPRARAYRRRLGAALY